MLTRSAPVDAAVGKIKKIGSTQIANNSIKGIDVKNGSLGGDDLNIYIAQSDFAPLQGGGITASAIASCNPGDNILGGGGAVLNAPQGAQLSAQFPQNNGNVFQWATTGVNYSNVNAEIQSVAICMVD